MQQIKKFIETYCKACFYALSRWESLMVYTTDPALSIDSLPIERQIRYVALGRKNWMFCASEVGADALAIIYSIINSCRMQKIDPFLYVEDILQRISDVPASKINELLPRNWKPTQ